MPPSLGPLRQAPAGSELAAALIACRQAFIAIGVFSGVSNLLMLSGALFMLEIYDRVLPSRSVPTLIALVILVTGLYAAQGAIETIRSRILVRVGNSLDEAMSMRVYDAIVRLPLKSGSRAEGAQPIRDLDTVRGFLSGAGPVALFDLPWMPIYLIVCFVFHTYIGLTALTGAIILVTLTVLTELRTRRPTRTATQFAAARNALMEASRRNAEAITAMGMVGRIGQRWGDLNSKYVASSQQASDVESAAAVAAVRHSRGRRLAGDQSAIDAGHHHRRLDPRRPRAGAGRSCDRQLARLCRRAAKLGAAFEFAGASSGSECTDAVAAAGAHAGRAGRCGRGAGRPDRRLPGRQFLADRRQGARRDRTDGVGQIVAGAHAGRGVDAGARQHPARRRQHRPMGAGSARPPHRLSAAGRRIVSRQRGAEHRPLRGSAGRRSRACRGASGRC